MTTTPVLYKLPVFLTRHKDLYDYNSQIHFINIKLEENEIFKVLKWLNSSTLPIHIDNIPKMETKELILEMTMACSENANEQVKTIIETLKTVILHLDTSIWNNLIESSIKISNEHTNPIYINNIEDINSLFYYIGVNMTLDDYVLNDEIIGPNIIFTNTQLLLISLIYWYILDKCEIITDSLNDIEKLIVSNKELLQNHALCLLIINLISFRINSIWIESHKNPNIMHIRNKLKSLKEYQQLKNTPLTVDIKDKIETFLYNNYLTQYQLLPYIFYDFQSKKQRSKSLIANLLENLKIKIPIDEITNNMEIKIKNMKNFSTYPIDFLDSISQSTLHTILDKIVINNQLDDNVFTTKLVNMMKTLPETVASVSSPATAIATSSSSSSNSINNDNDNDNKNNNNNDDDDEYDEIYNYDDDYYMN